MRKWKKKSIINLHTHVKTKQKLLQLKLKPNKQADTRKKNSLWEAKDHVELTWSRGKRVPVNSIIVWMSQTQAFEKRFWLVLCGLEKTTKAQNWHFRNKSSNDWK